MQKKIIALAVAAALTAPALAFAEATVYGKINLSIDMVDDGVASPGTSASTNQLVSNNSRLGVKGSEDLGGGLSAIWQMEGTIAMDAGTTNTTSVYGATTTSIFDRNTWLGLKAGWGSVMAGRNDVVYKTATRRLDVFGDQLANDNRKSLGVSLMGTIGGFASQDARLPNTLTYVSPKLGDAFTVSASTVFGAESTTGAAKEGDLMSLAAAYDQGPFYAALAYQTSTYGTAGTGDMGGASGASCTAGTNTAPCLDDEITAIKLGGSFKMDAFTIGAVYEDISYDAKTVGQSGSGSGTNMYLAGTFNFSPNDKIKLSYTLRGETEFGGVKNTDEATAMAIGYDHAMSKNTSVYVSYTTVDQDINSGTAADPSVFNIGMVTSF